MQCKDCGNLLPCAALDELQTGEDAEAVLAEVGQQSADGCISFVRKPTLAEQKETVKEDIDLYVMKIESYMDDVRAFESYLSSLREQLANLEQTQD